MTVSIGRLEPSKEDVVVGRDATMAFKKGARLESALDSGATCHGYIVRFWLVSQSDSAGAGVR